MKLIDNITQNKTSYEPYKYVMNDTSNIYIGAKFTYEELLESEDLAFKLKSIISQYILKESDKTNTLEAELYYLTPENFVYKTYEQLKCKVKVQMMSERKTLFGKTKSEYKEQIISLKELTQINLAKKKGAGLIVSEVIISKLALMSFTV